ncbi:putative membrane protein-like protein [Emericellopsis cladophorae]|uniref:Membrane protein-like protein n=1 Tax=Emericellopsis cladophorae TaxID=2686198 RepID=A0A9Q0BFK3_9HYPO|nr:putative membrane protein-like protein [Emericellopsis cladophorae]KAI6782389.1 putative membrane protein-like protein [Emericellopsis cladophorae]
MSIPLQTYDHEDVPFLDHPDEPIPDEPIYGQRRPTSKWHVRSPRAIVLVIASINFVLVMSGLMLLLPVYRLIEDALCHAHYHDDSPGLIDEMKCKVDQVQSRLAFLLGWLGVVGSVFNFIVAYPYGLLADRIGRKPTALFAFSGVAVSFLLSPLLLGPGANVIRANPYVLLTGTLFTFFGGGAPVMLRALYAMAADVSSAEEKAKHFFYLTMGTTAGAILGPLFGGLLMESFGPWLPIWIVTFTVPVVFFIFAFLPETLAVDTKERQATTRQLTLRQHVAQGVQDLVRSLYMMRNVNIALCMLVILFTSSAETSILVQYISKHFGWTLAETSVLLAPRGVINLLVLGLLPKLGDRLVSPRYGFTAFEKDLLLAKVSLCVSALSALGRFFSGSIGPFLVALFIGSLGAAESPLVRAVVSSYVQPSFTSRLFALAGMFEVIGTVLGGPVFAWCFGKGLQWKGLWTGLPWLYMALAMGLCAGALMLVRPRNGDFENDVFGEAEEDENARPANPVRLV